MSPGRLITTRIPLLRHEQIWISWKKCIFLFPINMKRDAIRTVKDNQPRLHWSLIKYVKYIRENIRLISLRACLSSSRKQLLTATSNQKLFRGSRVQLKWKGNACDGQVDARTDSKITPLCCTFYNRVKTINYNCKGIINSINNFIEHWAF